MNQAIISCDEMNLTLSMLINLFVFLMAIKSACCAKTIQFEIGEKRQCTACKVGMTVKECRNEISKNNPFLGKTIGFCKPKTTEELREEDLLLEDKMNFEALRIVDYSFKSPTEYTVYGCMDSMLRSLDKLKHRLDESICKHLKYSLTTKDDSVFVQPENSLLIKMGGQYIPLPLEKSVNTKQLLELRKVDFSCDLHGNEGSDLAEQDYMRPSLRHSVRFMVNGFEFEQMVLICQKTTINQLTHRLSKLYGDVKKTTCGFNVACSPDNLVNDVQNKNLTFHFESTEKMLHRFPTQRCRWCTVMACIAGVMTVNAALAVVAALYIRHQNNDNHS